MKISKQLQNELEFRIQSLEAEDAFFRDFLAGTGPQGASSVNDAKANQIGVTVPRYAGAMDTFIANPSNVGIGILARMLETDETVLTSVQFKSLMMISKIGEYQHDNPEIMDFVNEFLARMTTPTWKQALEAMSSHSGYGFSVSEIIWGINDKNQKVPLKLKTYHPSTLCFEVDAAGEITDEGIIQFILQFGQISNPNNYFPYFGNGFQVKNPFETPVDRLVPIRMPFVNNYGMVRIPKSKCIHHVNNSLYSFGSPYGKSSVRTAHLAWQMKVFFMKQMGIAGKRQASPFVWGTAPHNQNKVRVKKPDGKEVDMNPIDALTLILASRESDDSIVTGPQDQGYSIQAIPSQSNLDQYLNVINNLNTWIFRAFALPSLIMSDGQAGSRALGDKHFQIVDRIAEEEAVTFGQTIIDQMVRQTIEDNFGRQEDFGHFAQRPQSIEERERLANMFVNLGNGGWMSAHNKTDGEYVRSTLHLPDQDESFYVEPMPNYPPADDSGDGDKEGDQL